MVRSEGFTPPLHHSGKHAPAFTQGNDFTLQPAISILLVKVLEQAYHSHSAVWIDPKEGFLVGWAP